MSEPDEELETAATASPQDVSDDIRSTDIVFDCPHCGHNLCIDFRGAGMMTNCAECAREVLVPIPEGMKVEDLDLTTEQALGELFATRRALLRAEARIVAHEEVANSLRERRSAMEKSRLATLHHCAELTNICQSIQRCQGDIAAALVRMSEIISAEQQH